MTTIQTLLYAYFFLVVGIFVGDGFYHPEALAMLLISFALLGCAFVWASRGASFDDKVPGRTSFALILVLLLAGACKRPVTHFVASSVLPQLYHGWVVVLALLIAGAYLLSPHCPTWVRRSVFLVAVAAAFGFRLWLPFASPTPEIDTFTTAQESAEHLLDGKNPYSTPVTDIYEGKVDYGYKITAYAYLPSNLYLQTVAYGLLGDVRYACVFAEAVVALSFWLLAKRRWDPTVAELIVLLFLYQPRGLLVVELAWTDPLNLLLFSLFLLAYDNRKEKTAAAVFGFFLSLKQYLVFFLLHWFLIEKRWSMILLALTAGALTVLPFAIADPSSVITQGLLLNLRTPFRTDSLTIFGLLSPATGIVPPKAWSLIVGLLISAILVVPSRKIPGIRGYLFAVTITMFGVFLFGSQGFCNYYYLVGGLLLFLIAAG
jgi:hypothetical protein